MSRFDGYIQLLKYEFTKGALTPIVLITLSFFVISSNWLPVHITPNILIENICIFLYLI